MPKAGLSPVEGLGPPLADFLRAMDSQQSFPNKHSCDTLRNISNGNGYDCNIIILAHGCMRCVYTFTHTYIHTYIL